MKQLDKLAHWIKKGTPQISVTTVDGELFAGAVVKHLGSELPVLQWKKTTGVMPLNDKAVEAATIMNSGPEGALPREVTGEAKDALGIALAQMPNDCILLMQNFNFYLNQKDEMARLDIIQAVQDCRSKFKSTGRALILVCNDIQIPPELANDFREIHFPYPTVDEIEAMIRKLAVDNEFPVFEENVKKAAKGMLGMSIFTAENVAASCLSDLGYDLAEIQQEQIADINRTPGLRAEIVAPMTRDTLVGLDGVCDFVDACYAGDDPFTLTIIADEFEKAVAGAGGSDGSTQDFLGQLLTNMEEKRWRGTMFYGAGGTGKTETAKYIASRSGMLVWMDVGATKDKFVGESERKSRLMFAKLFAMGGNGVFFTFTVNGMANIPAPLLRRVMNLWIYNFPTVKAQEQMWKYYAEKFNVPQQTVPAHPMWTGAEIKKCASFAGGMLRKPDGALWTLDEAAKYITPIFEMMGDEVDKLYRGANGKYLDPATGGTFRYKGAITAKEVKRAIGKN